MAAVRACRGLAEPQEQVGLTFLAYLFMFLFLKIHERHPISAQLQIPQYFFYDRLFVHTYDVILRTGLGWLRAGEKEYLQPGHRFINFWGYL